MGSSILSELKLALENRDSVDQIDFLKQDRLKIALLFVLKKEEARALEIFSKEDFFFLEKND